MTDLAHERFLKPLPEGMLFGDALEIYRFDPEKMWKIAEQMVGFSLDVQKGDKVMIEYHPGARQLAEFIVHLAAHKGAVIFPRAIDPVVEAQDMRISPG